MSHLINEKTTEKKEIPLKCPLVFEKSIYYSRMQLIRTHILKKSMHFK
jgi:hypothetical protein